MLGGKVFNRNVQYGFTYVAMLFGLAIFAIGLAALGQMWSRASQREKEDELLQVGAAYARAIEEYYQRSPGTPKAYPARLEDLLEDRRFVGIERHLRRLYRDPVTNSPDWGIVRAPDRGIIGIYSLSEKETLRKRPMMLHGATVVGNRYSEWKFIYQVEAGKTQPAMAMGRESASNGQ